ncbi:MAG: hypothetical protein NZ585_03390 [Chloracidobacterium sp.]|nr:hypothetical protein [Chloracidobacterium sp.]MDW8217210.1 hypothetical protein [Acidobacteriota bacterium]
MAGEITYTSVARLAAEGIVELTARTQRGDLHWRPTATAPVARFVVEDNGVRYTLTAGRDGLPTILTAFDTARRLVLWKVSAAAATHSALSALEQLVTTQFAPVRSAHEPDWSRVVLFPLRPVSAGSTALVVERSA